MIAVQSTAEVEIALAASAPVAIGVSGGKDSQAAAVAVVHHLKHVGHTGPVVLIHADLGRADWNASLPTCEALAKHLDLELIVVRRQAGDLIERWRGRWSSNIRRYRDLECMKLIPPFSTARMRFCTSELKVAPIASALRKRFPRGPLVNVAGIRSEESAQRARMPISKANAKLSRKDAPGIQWHPILAATKEQVFRTIAESGLALHPAYTELQLTRVSCRFCILGSLGDLQRAAGSPEAAELYREICALEMESTFSFQSGRFLASLKPDLLGDNGQMQLVDVLRRARRREEIESLLPAAMLYEKGWPTRVPSMKEAEVIARVRCQVADLVGIPVMYVSPKAVCERIQELMDTRMRTSR